MFKRILSLFRKPMPEPVSDFRDHPRMIAKAAMRKCNGNPDLAGRFERTHTILDLKLGRPYLPTPERRDV